ncbi:Predicted PurR-regulated permease PerM [Clostridium sp. DSM 8431]|uniref:AI-2E family transporter n=1 Tax=Clostridium sp. DSM 8431 TaxID=1761781 RepID=UPI0008E7C48B|nr:AI-2E family transporter [Clostridium sp. DSM 8431]SFU44372.1 Predicted PurR-regulated permease PerM [Clostridium sp. DSM 8431]
MEFRKDYNTLIKLILLLIAVTVVTFAVKYYFQPFIAIILLLIITNPLYNLMVKLRLSPKISAALSILFVNIIVVISIIYLGNSIYNVTLSFYKNNLYKIEEFITNIVSIFNVESVSGKSSNILNTNFIKNGALSTGEWVFSYFVANISVFFLLVDRRNIIDYFLKLIPSRVFIKIKRQKKNLMNMFVIEIILVLISTLEITFGFVVLRIGHPMFLGILCGVLDILPYVGTIIVFIPIIIYNIIVKQYIVSFGLILLYILVQICREILEAKFLGDKLELHPLLVLLSIYIGVKVFGIIGAIVGPIYGMLAKEIVEDE